VDRLFLVMCMLSAGTAFLSMNSPLDDLREYAPERDWAECCEVGDAKGSETSRVCWAVSPVSASLLPSPPKSSSSSGL
jgi:hypothetical protein